MHVTQPFVDFMTELASAMGFEWSLGKIGSNDISLNGPDGAEIWVRSDTWEYDPTNGGRLEIGGCYPRVQGTSFKGDDAPKNISCAVSKSTDQIAKDIQRRFVRHYLPAHQSALQNFNEHLEAKAKHRAQLEAIAQAADIEPPPPEGERVHLFPRSSYPLHGTAETYKDRIHLDVRGIPWDLGLEIIRILTNYEEVQSNAKT